MAAAAVLLTAALGAESLTGIPNPRTRDGTWVTDMAGALRPETIARLNTTIGELERSNTAEMTVVVIKSLDGLAIEEAAVKLFELWGIGKKHKDNGLLFLWSTGDRRVRVEVGYGLEGALPDGKVGAILDTYVIPKFKAGNFDEGVLAGVDALVRVARAEPVELASAKSESYERTSWGLATLLAGISGTIMAAIGSIVGVRRWRRYGRRCCPECDAWMTRLAETEDDALLAAGQQAEERVGSVDYDVWKCGACSHHFTESRSSGCGAAEDWDEGSRATVRRRLPRDERIGACSLLRWRPVFLLDRARVQTDAPLRHSGVMEIDRYEHHETRIARCPGDAPAVHIAARYRQFDGC